MSKLTDIIKSVSKELHEATKSGHGSRYNTYSRTGAGRYGGRVRNKLAEEDVDKKKKKQQNQTPYEVNLEPELNTISQTR